MDRMERPLEQFDRMLGSYVNEIASAEQLLRKKFNILQPVGLEHRGNAYDLVRVLVDEKYPFYLRYHVAPSTYSHHETEPGSRMERLVPGFPAQLMVAMVDMLLPKAFTEDRQMATQGVSPKRDEALRRFYATVQEAFPTRKIMLESKLDGELKPVLAVKGPNLYLV